LKKNILVNLPEGSILTMEGEDSDCVYLIIDGEVQLTKTLAEKEYDLLVLSRGHFVGEYGMLMREKSVFTSVTKTPVAAVKIDKDVFAKSLKRDPTLQSTLFMNMTTKFNLYNQGIEKIIKDLEEGNPKQAVEQPKKAPIEEEKSTVKEEQADPQEYVINKIENLDNDDDSVESLDDLTDEEYASEEDRELHTDASLFSWINRFFVGDKTNSPLSSIDIAFYPFTNDSGDKIRKEVTSSIEKLLGFSVNSFSGDDEQENREIEKKAHLVILGKIEAEDNSLELHFVSKDEGKETLLGQITAYNSLHLPAQNISKDAAYLFSAIVLAGIIPKQKSEQELIAVQLPIALKVAEKAIKNISSDIKDVKSAQNLFSLGKALARQGIISQNKDYIKKARSIFEQSLPMISKKDEISFMIIKNQIGLCNRYLVQSCKDHELIYEAIKNFLDAQSSMIRESNNVLWSAIDANIGGLYYLLAFGNGSKEDIKRSLQYLNSSLSFYSKEKHLNKWIETTNRIALAFALHGVLSGITSSIDTAISLSFACLEAKKKEDDPLLWGVTTFRIGVYHFLLARYKEPSRQMNLAIKYLSNAIDTFMNCGNKRRANYASTYFIAANKLLSSIGDTQSLADTENTFADTVIKTYLDNIPE